MVVHVTSRSLWEILLASKEICFGTSHQNVGVRRENLILLFLSNFYLGYMF